MAIKKDPNENCFGVCFFDISISKCYIGCFSDDSAYSILRTTLAQIRPVEVIIEKDKVLEDIEKMLKNFPIQPIFNFYASEKCYDFDKTINSLDKYFTSIKRTSDSMQVLTDIRTNPN